jgi:hypothetical protein
MEPWVEEKVPGDRIVFPRSQPDGLLVANGGHGVEYEFDDGWTHAKPLPGPAAIAAAMQRVGESEPVPSYKTVGPIQPARGRQEEATERAGQRRSKKAT